MDFSEIIKLERTMRGYSQKDLAELIGVTQQAVGRWEKENVFPETNTILLLAKLFSVSTDYLFGLTDKRNPENSQPLSNEDIKALEDGRKIQNLPPDRKKSIEILLNYKEQSATQTL